MEKIILWFAAYGKGPMGGSRGPVPFTGVFIPVWTCKAYTLKEKINIWGSKFSYIKKTRLNDELLAMDIPNTVPGTGA